MSRCANREVLRNNNLADADQKFSLEGCMAKKSRRGLDGRHRDKNGRMDRKHGNTKVTTLRKEYGESFAKGRRGDLMLKTLLKETGSVIGRLLKTSSSVAKRGEFLILVRALDDSPLLLQL
jgi:hypothetical protein